VRPTLRCVIFDLDGVLTDTAELHYRAWQRMADELKLPFDRAVNEELRGVSRGESLQIILRHAGVSMPEAERGVLAERKNGYYRELISTVTTADLLPGMPALLAALRDRGIRTGLASVSHNAAEIIRRLGIEDAIDCAVNPADVVKGKPDPEVFLRAADALGMPSRDCAGVEDAQVGITAIKAAGMFAVGIGSALTGADWLLPDTRGLTLEGLLEHFDAAW
jgi:beta-phosphoglucomutase